MAEPNYAAVMEMVAFYADRADEFEKYAGTASTGWIATNEALRNDLEGTYPERLTGQLDADRAIISAVLEPGAMAAGFRRASSRTPSSGRNAPTKFAATASSFPKPGFIRSSSTMGTFMDPPEAAFDRGVTAL